MQRNHDSRVPSAVASCVGGRLVSGTRCTTDVALFAITELDVLRVELLGLIRGFRQEPGG